MKKAFQDFSTAAVKLIEWIDSNFVFLSKIFTIYRLLREKISFYEFQVGTYL